MPFRFSPRKAEAAQWLAAQGQARFFSAAAVTEKEKSGSVIMFLMEKFKIYRKITVYFFYKEG